jgi:hypothetical protein
MKNEVSVLPKEQNKNSAGSIVPDSVTESILMRHLACFQANELEAVISDYTDDSILVTEDATFVGVSQIRDFFAGLITHFPKQNFSFELNKIVVRNELAFIVWSAKTPSLEVALGSDTFIIKDGKIYRQTFVRQVTFLD